MPKSPQKPSRATKRNQARSTAAKVLKAVRHGLKLTRNDFDRKRATGEWIAKPKC